MKRASREGDVTDGNEAPMNPSDESELFVPPAQTSLYEEWEGSSEAESEVPIDEGPDSEDYEASQSGSDVSNVLEESSSALGDPEIIDVTDKRVQSNQPPAHDIRPVRQQLLGTVGIVRFSVAVTREPWSLGTDCLVIPWLRSAGPGGLGAESLSALQWDPVDPGSPDSNTPVWSPMDTTVGSRSPDDPVSRLRGVVMVTATGLTPSAETAQAPATVLGAGQAAGAAVRMAQQHRVSRLAMPLIGAGNGGLSPIEVADAVVSATRLTVTNGGPSSLAAVVFIAADSEELSFIQTAWAGYRTQAFTNDRPDGPDLLGVRDEVHALADMLLLREVTPPLAVGILGGWGSGKSFVMHLMRERMREIRSEVIAPDQGWNGASPSPFVGHVYPIDFNAWTFARADLWAALMQRVLTELDRQIGIERRLASKNSLLDGKEWERLTRTSTELHKLYEDTAVAGKEGESLFQTLHAVHQADCRALDKARNDLEHLKAGVATDETRIEQVVESKIEKQTVDAEVRTAALAPLADIVKASTAQIQEWLASQGPGLTGAVDTAETTVAEVRALEVELGNVRRPPPNLVAAAVWKRREVRALTGLSLLVTVATVVIWRTFPGAIVSAGSALTAIAAGLRYSRELIEKFRWQAEQSRQRLADQIREIEASKVAKMATARLNDENLQQKQQKIASIESVLDHLKKRVGLVEEFKSVGDLIDDRLQQGTYTERLGVMQQISDDLTSLTRSLVVDEEDPHASEKQSIFPRGPARVVLFIDDIDRCPPRKVVEVLEAVQLLLSTNLFVVVLALDVQYVTKALEKVYKGVLSADGDPSGLDYLEKIIQIPYRTRRPTGDGALQFMAGQLRVAEDVEVSASPAPGPPVPMSDSDRPTDSGGIDAATVARELLFTKDDLVVVAASCRMLQLTPRAGKRMANAVKLFRLVWARRGHGRPELEDIATVAMIVGMASAHPEVQRDALALLERLMTDPAEQGSTLLDALGRLTRPPGSDLDAEVQRYQRWRTDLDQFRSESVTVGEQTSERSITIGAVELESASQVVDFVSAFCFVGDDLPRLSPTGASY